MFDSITLERGVPPEPEPDGSATRTDPTVDAAKRAESAVTVLQAIADPIRWAVLERLACKCECVCDLQETIEIASNLLSYHLRVLREAGLVTTARRGRWIDYSLAADAHERMLAALPAAPETGVASCEK